MALQQAESSSYAWWSSCFRNAVLAKNHLLFDLMHNMDLIRFGLAAMTLVFFLVFLTTPVDTECAYNMHPWSPSWINPQRYDLCCDNYCKKYPVHDDFGKWANFYDQCCVCYSKAVWEGKETNLFVEFISVIGESIALIPDEKSVQDFYKIELRNSEMSRIPNNICFYPSTTTLYAFGNEGDIEYLYLKIVTINFERNKIRELGRMNCLKNLDTLILDYNRISHVHKTSLEGLTRLRNLYLSHNHIITVEAGFVSLPDVFIFHADFSHNLIKVIDVSSLVALFTFCYFDFSNNVITEISNDFGFELNSSYTYGPGMIDFGYNLFESFPDLEYILGLDDLTQLGQLINFGFDFTGMKLICDCHFQPFSNLSENIKESLWTKYFEVTCGSPEELAGEIAINVDKNRLVCHLKYDDHCPKECTCIDQPQTNTVYVDCSNAGLREMPTSLPKSRYSDYTFLNLSINQITRISNMSYLSRLSYLDISGNLLSEFEKDSTQRLENCSLDVSNNRPLRSFPTDFQYRKICNFTMIGDVTIDCGCSDSWIENWVIAKGCDVIKLGDMFVCELDDNKLVSGLEFTIDLIDCEPTTYLLYFTLIGGTIAALVLVAMFVYIFKYEIIILWMRMKQSDLNKVVKGFQFDVALTFNEEDALLRKWVIQHLWVALESKGYRVFIPFKDVSYGSERDSEVIEAFSESRSFLLILSESYINEWTSFETEHQQRPWTENEWKYAWIQCRNDRRKTLAIINYDLLRSCDITHGQIAACLRVGRVVEFRNDDDDIMERVFRNICVPEYDPICKGLDNKKKRFQDNDTNEKMVPSIGGTISLPIHFPFEKLFTDNKIYPGDEKKTMNKPREAHEDILFILPGQLRNPS